MSVNLRSIYNKNFNCCTFMPQLIMKVRNFDPCTTFTLVKNLLVQPNFQARTFRKFKGSF